MARRTTLLVSAAASVALCSGLLTACEWDDSVLGCHSNASTITDSVNAINRAGVDAIKDPTKTEESIKTIQKNIDTINDSDDKDDKKVDKAVDDLKQAIEDYNRDVLNGDSPDSSAVDKAAEKLKDVCGK